MSDLDKITSIFNATIDSLKTKDDLQNIKTEFFGKNGQITQQFKSLGSLDHENRKEFASKLNKIKDDLTNQLEQKNIEIEASEINEKLGSLLIADCIIEILILKTPSLRPVSMYVRCIIHYRSDYVTPLVTGSHTYHSDQCTIDFLRRSV